MMDQMMGGGMMWGMGLIGLLVVIVLLLGAAALVKYLFFSKKRACGRVSLCCGLRMMESKPSAWRIGSL